MGVAVVYPIAGAEPDGYGQAAPQHLVAGRTLLSGDGISYAWPTVESVSPGPTRRIELRAAGPLGLYRGRPFVSPEGGPSHRLFFRMAASEPAQCIALPHNPGAISCGGWSCALSKITEPGSNRYVVLDAETGQTLTLIYAGFDYSLGGSPAQYDGTHWWATQRTPVQWLWLGSRIYQTPCGPRSEPCDTPAFGGPGTCTWILGTSADGPSVWPPLVGSGIAGWERNPWFTSPAMLQDGTLVPTQGPITFLSMGSAACDYRLAPNRTSIQITIAGLSDVDNPADSPYYGPLLFSQLNGTHECAYTYAPPFCWSNAPFTGISCYKTPVHFYWNLVSSPNLSYMLHVLTVDDQWQIQASARNSPSARQAGAFSSYARGCVAYQLDDAGGDWSGRPEPDPTLGWVGQGFQAPPGYEAAVAGASVVGVSW